MANPESLLIHSSWFWINKNRGGVHVIFKKHGDGTFTWTKREFPNGRREICWPASRTCHAPGNEQLPDFTRVSQQWFAPWQLTRRITRAFPAVFEERRFPADKWMSPSGWVKSGDTVEGYGCIISVYDQEVNGELTLRVWRTQNNDEKRKKQKHSERRDRKAPDSRVVLAQHPDQK